MRILLDTHVFLWSTARDKLSEAAATAFLDADNQLFLSAASYWEICIKVSIGKLVLTDEWIQDIDDEMASNGIKWLPIEKEHCQKMAELPFLHKDPFDRLLISQAICQNMTLLTADTNIHQYTVSTLW